MFICEFFKIFKNIFRKTNPDDCICEFWEAFQITSFIGHLWETAYFMHKLQDFNHKIQYKVFHKCFSSILYKNKK